MSAELIAERAGELAVRLAAPVLDGVSLVGSLEMVGEIRRLIEAVGVDLAGKIEELSGLDREHPLAKGMGERSAVNLVEVCAGLDRDDAFAWCRVGAALQPRVSLQGEVLPSRHEALAEALAAGRLRVSGASRVLGVLEEIGPYATVDELQSVEAFLVGEAPGLVDRQFARLCRAFPDTFNPDGVLPRENELRRRAGVMIRRTPDGLERWTLILDPELAAYLNAAVDARTAPRRAPKFRGDDAGPEAVLDVDHRPLSDRRLDALKSIARESIGSDTGMVAGTSVTLNVTMTLESLITGLGTAKIAGIDEPISARTARRMAAQAEIIPVVLGGPSEPLDMGRAVRLATEPQRRALAIRDGGCIWPGCTAPPGWCEVAHRIPWANGGTTDLENLMLLCPFHHRCFDLDGWRLEWRDGERYFVPPPWVDPAQKLRLVRTHQVAPAA